MAVQIFFYRPRQLGLTSYHEDQPSRFTFSLCECANIHYVFPKTQGQNLTQMPGEAGAVFLPEIVKVMLSAMAAPGYIQDVEAHLAALKRTNYAEADE